ncbi:hypothetical protein N7466_001040 [Penicillium verhagenii]|uniref:uncharacterized protein n=1 Tax=Penicillium verhagenii TaxID=1562060 RepID=UPI0025457E45|nr:uncharacterized protein N7466_001040 [Penicillium verhagenii]KAJ5948025.1 hypothetical protein N7466_001040 [Penicillium verhagenii]
MAIDQSDEAALQILLEELDYLEDQQKGKGVSGKSTDWEIAMNSMREQILIAQTCARDEILAISMSTAVATDQNILASIQKDETHATQDHQLALALSNGEIPAQTMQERGENSDSEEDDAVSTVMCDLMNRIVIGEGSDNGEGPSNSSFSPRISAVTKQCCSCMERFHSLMFTGSCGHEFCKDCIRSMFLGAIKDEELYPPRCCGQIVPPGVALRVLNYEELREFGARAVEWTAKDRLYCAEQTCSKFIPPYAIRDEIGTCPSCYQRTHLTCRSLEHPGVDCPMDEALQRVLEIAKGEDWRRCFHCQAMVELDHGCNHITCRSVYINTSIKA